MDSICIRGEAITLRPSCVGPISTVYVVTHPDSAVRVREMTFWFCDG